jgi:hypothetical protein
MGFVPLICLLFESCRRKEADVAENAGLYQKFDVKRVDGRDSAGGDREGACYFVIDVTNDPGASGAIRGYLASCAGSLPLLEADLDGLLAELERGERGGPFMRKLRAPRR